MEVEPIAHCVGAVHRISERSASRLVRTDLVDPFGDRIVDDLVQPAAGHYRRKDLHTLGLNLLHGTIVTAFGIEYLLFVCAHW